MLVVFFFLTRISDFNFTFVYESPSCVKSRSQWRAWGPLRFVLAVHATQGSGKSHVEVLQAALILLGYDTGPMDGILGKSTRRALQKFQSDNRLSPTGNLDSATLSAVQTRLRVRRSSQSSGGRCHSASCAVECQGYNSETGAYIHGECDGGSFEGYDSQSGTYVYGDCEPGGNLEAYHSETSVYIYGDCEDYSASCVVQCQGYNSETSTYVSGECSGGSFDGYDSETGNYVYGDCTVGGDLEAYDSETSAYVYGDCEEP